MSVLLCLFMFACLYLHVYIVHVCVAYSCLHVFLHACIDVCVCMFVCMFVFFLHVLAVSGVGSHLSEPTIGQHIHANDHTQHTSHLPCAHQFRPVLQ